ncbi:RIC1-domain-containing protein [Microstroma glucosiphilum]|uniref:RIC1-domain-containing protein n=1 Tax=Pseudomicrostroma glucosiphilum TaxID=1684307 RepID=A0A316TZL5_9BASI|nr:RIC1-domain-containing protein [Pseudomicrostroma glucosiphilum]PWN18420.1 RIC1-domain-containing protein [Pseudomicrostroma glucosiphilum]
MYWPLNVARRLLPPALPSDGAGPSSEPAVHLCPSPPSFQPSYFILLTPSCIHLYSVRPAQAVASLRRTERSLQEYGHNVRCHWRPGSVAAEIAVETSSSYLLIYSIEAASLQQTYSYAPPPSANKAAPSSKALKAAFAASAGEIPGSWAAGQGELRVGEAGGSDNAGRAAGRTGGAALEIHLKLALRVDAGLSCALAITSHLLIATKSPPAVQAIPWPDDTSEQLQTTAVLASLPWFHSGTEASQRPDETHESASEPLGENKVEEAEMNATPSKANGNEMEATAHAHQTASTLRATNIISLHYSRAMHLCVWVASDGRSYVASLDDDAEWLGRCFHNPPPRRRRSRAHREGSEGLDESIDRGEAEEETLPLVEGGKRATVAAINAKIGLIAAGQEDGTIEVFVLRTQHRAVPSHTLSLRVALRSTASYLTSGPVRALQWTADGLALAVGWEKGWAVWSAWGKLMGHSFTDSHLTNRSKNFSDTFMDGLTDLFWGPGGTNLIVLAGAAKGSRIDPHRQLFSIPFAKSAVAGQHSPDNTRFAFIQLDDSLLVYRGSEQPDMSIINPESDVWHHIKVPQDYFARNWPIRYASISTDGRLIAVAGRRGLAHYSAISGRWKIFSSTDEEEAFQVRGGLQWYEHVLIAACQSGDAAQLRLYSRDTDLSNANLLHIENVSAPVILTSLFEDSLLVYTSDNTFYHFLIVITRDSINLSLCGSITFEGVVGEPERVRGMSWMIPKGQQRFGDPMDDLTVATIIFLVDGKLVLLRPRKAEDNEAEVAYDMQILGDRIEYYWTHLQGIGTLENSLWGYDGTGIKLWLDALTIEQARPHNGSIVDSDEAGSEYEYEDEAPEYKTIEESLSMPLDFYPLCIVLEKGIIIGVEPEVSLRRNLEFAIFRSATTTHLFLHQLLRYYLEHGRMREAVTCASFYQSLVYFPHALEVLLHAVLEDEAEGDVNVMTHSNSNGSIADTGIGDTSMAEPAIGDGNGVTRRQSLDDVSGRPLLPIVVDFLDHFDESLSVVVACARKTEVERWPYLFGAVGEPKVLFEKCLAAGSLQTAGSYLLVLQTVESLEESIADTARLLALAAQREEWVLCQDLLRYTRSMDESGQALQQVVKQAGILQELPDSPSGASFRSYPPAPPPLMRTVSGSTTLDVTHEEEEGEEEEEVMNGQEAETSGYSEDQSGQSLEGFASHSASSSSANLSADYFRASPQRRLSGRSSFASSPVGGAGAGGASRLGGTYSTSDSPLASPPLAPPVPQLTVNGRIMPSMASRGGG